MCDTSTPKRRVCEKGLLRQPPIKENNAAASDICFCVGRNADMEGILLRGSTSYLTAAAAAAAAAAATTQPRWITTRPRGERMRRWGIKSGLAHTSQDSTPTTSTVLQSTAEVATL